MKGIVLAGGLGTRLMPLTAVTNKHLLPVYNQPMVYYPIQTLVNAGISEIMIVTGGNSAGDFLKLLKNGTLKVYEKYPHGMCTTHADVINADLLAFVQKGTA